MQIQDIKKAVEKAFEVDNIIFDSNSRKRELVDARRAFVYLANKNGFSKRSLAKYINKDRATVYHLIKSAQNLMTYEKEFRRKLIDAEFNSKCPSLDDLINISIIDNVIKILDDAKTKLLNLKKEK